MARALSQDIIDIFVDFGAQRAAGDDSIVRSAMFAAGLVNAKLADEDNAADFYAGYLRGKTGNAVFTSGEVVNKGSLKTQVSCYRTWLKPEVIRQNNLHNVALEVFEQLEPKARKENSAYNSLVAVNRAQVKKGNVCLTKDEITAVISKAPAAEKSDIDKLEDTIAKLQKLDDALGGMMSPIAALRKRVAELKAAAVAEVAEVAEDTTEEVATEEVASDEAQVIPSDNKPKLAVVPTDGNKLAIAELLSNLGNVKVNA